MIGWGRTRTDDDVAALKRQVQAARIKAARANESWTEMSPPERLIRRGPGGRIIVDAETDEMFTVYHGAVFGTSTASIDFGDSLRSLSFIVNSAGDVVFYEPMHQRWSDVVERRERRRLQTGTAS